MAAEYPTWHPEKHRNFDAIMSKACANIWDRLRSEPSYCSAVLLDPRHLHKDLYAALTPQGYPEYAGTYRGTRETTLESRVSVAPSVMEPAKVFQFIPPNEVPSTMARVLPGLKDMRSQATTAWEQLWALTNLFIQFGKIHPFLDGNGHTQRVLFAAGALEMGIPLSDRFAIHPRSYDFLLAYALERFTRSARDEEQSQWGMAVAEYLAQWLAGPFDAPGSGLPPV